MTEATRLPDLESASDLPPGLDMKAICYWKAGGRWWLYLPRGGIGNLAGHDVEEHEDGTITVTPSILVTASSGATKRHGFLTKGVWHPCGDDQPVQEEGR